MSLADVTSARSSPTPEACPECDTSASVTSDLHKYQVPCTCKPASVQYACADDPGPAPPAKTDTPPALPPRPPTSVLATNRRNNASVCNNDTSCRRRKYAWWCCGCGALAAALGGLLAAQHILLRAYTASPQHLETVPAAVPAAMLVLTGVCIMSLARRRNRYSYMIKVVGACCLVCALTCVLVTITTTVIHMNKLQTLKFCEYTKLTRTCTCFSMPPDTQRNSNDDEGVRCVFEGVSECGVVHGALYWCLRGVFALSVSAVLVCIFSCMLAYQLLSHERKKMYWEQLELRCRSLYRPPSGQPAPTAGRQVQSACSCCTQCHPAQPAWDISLQHRFWAPGRIGNLYSPNPGTGRKTSAWSWFPWPRSNSQNSRCQMGVPQSGDSAYGFCDNDAPPHPAQAQTYDERYPGYNQFRQGQPQQFQGQQLAFSGEGFAEAGGSIDAQTGVWGPPPPYSPQGRSGSRHHLHQDPAAATLLHHHHIDVHNSMTDHHTCSRTSYLMNQNMQDIRINPEMARMTTDLARINPEIARINPDMARINPDLARMNPEILRMNPELARINSDLARHNAEFARINPELSRINPELIRMNPELARINPDLAYPSDVNELARMQELSHLPEARFNTLRGHLIPYRSCPRPMGMSANNIHRDCREDAVAIECLHQKSASKDSDQSTDSCQKQGKENLGFQNDKHSPIRSSMQDCHRAVNQNAESEVYFADVSSCCNVSVKADCCLNPNVSALVGTIENHPESTSESDTSFTLTRQQRPQPQVGSKRRPRQEKHKDKRGRLTEIELNHTRIERMNDSRVSERDRNEPRCMNERCERNDSRDRLNEGLNDSRISERMNETRISERMNDSRVSDRMNDSRINDRICDRMNETRKSERMSDRMNEQRLNDTRISDRMNDSRISDRMNETRMSERSNDRLNDSRISERNDPRTSDRINETRLSERMSDRMNESRISDKINESRLSDRMNESRLNDSRISDRMNDSRILDRMNETRLSERMTEREPRIERMSDLNSSIRIEGSPKRSHMSPLRTLPEPADFLISPLSPGTEESVVSDGDGVEQVYCNSGSESDRGRQVYCNSAAGLSKQLKPSHHHCYSDTNTMDSGCHSGEDKQ